MPAFVWLFGAVIVILLVSLVSRILWRNTYVKHLPRVPLSTFSSFLFQVKSPKELFQSLERISNSNDGMTTIWFGPMLGVICDDPEDVKTIFTSKDCFDKPNVYRMLRLAGNGIFTASGMPQNQFNFRWKIPMGHCVGFSFLRSPWLAPGSQEH